jgi:hypothetical protein
MAMRNLLKAKKKRLQPIIRNDKVQSVAYAFVPLITFAFGWYVATVAILPIFMSPLIMVFAEWQWTRSNPYRGFDHKAGFGSFILYVLPFALVCWTYALFLISV